MSSSVVAFVTDGVSATGFTVIVAVADPLLKPPPEESVAPWAWKLPLAKEFAAGVNFKPALPSAKVMKVSLLITVVPSFLKSVPLVMLVILKCVTSAPSAGLRLITKPEVVWVSSLVVASVTDGVSAAAFTVIVAEARPPPNPPLVAFSDACTSKLPLAKEFAAGVNFKPALPSANVVKGSLVITAVPSFLNRVPPVMLLILKCVTSVPSAAFRLITSPEVVWVSSLVVALVTEGVSATGLTVIVAVADPLLKPPPDESVAPWAWKLPLAKEFAAGVNFKPALPSAKVMKVSLLITVVPSFLKSVPLVMLVILKCVTSAPSAGLRLITKPEVVWVSSLVVASVTDGVSAAAFTVIVAEARPPPNPPLVAFSDACTSKLPLAKEFAAGVNFKPALPSANVVKGSLVITAVPSFLNRVPPVMLLILKCVTSVPSAAFRLITSPEVVWVSSLVVALVTDGVSATGLTVIVAVADPLLKPPPDESVAPWAWKLPLAKEFAAGVNFKTAVA